MTDPLTIDRPVICPYDSNHRIAPSRIHRHLLKCSKNYPPNYKVQCPYNATHLLFKSEIEEHVATCKDCQYVDPLLYEVHTKTGAIPASSEVGAESVVDCKESWDDHEFHLVPQLVNHGNTYFIPIMPETITPTRPPKGLPEAMMLELPDDCEVDDAESVSSSLTGFENQKNLNKKLELLKKFAMSRGSSTA